MTKSGAEQGDVVTVLNSCQEEYKTNNSKVQHTDLTHCNILWPFPVYSPPYFKTCLFVSAFTSIQLIPGRSYRAANGLLSPPVEDPVRASQSSLCDILQEKEKKTSTSTGTGTSLGLAAGPGTAGTGMDHSALIHLRAKNFREKSDAHFVDVIREDRWAKPIQVDQGHRSPVLEGCNPAGVWFSPEGTQVKELSAW